MLYTLEVKTPYLIIPIRLLRIIYTKKVALSIAKTIS